MGLIADVVTGNVIASAWGNAIRDRTAQHFASRAERDAQWAARPVGAVCVTDDLPGRPQVYDGTGWMTYQQAAVILSTNSAGVATLAYPVPFLEAPAVELTGTTDSTLMYVVGLALQGLNTPTTLAVRAYVLLVGSPPALGSNSAVGFHYLAVGHV